jgi:hypothetical protein
MSVTTFTPKFLDIIRIRFADGTSLVRQVNETSARAGGVEFFTAHPGTYNTHGAATVAKIMQMGGTVKRPTRALLGEAGPEAVVPLDRAGGGRGIGGHTFNVSVNAGYGDPHAIAEAVRQVLEEHQDRWAVV